MKETCPNCGYEFQGGIKLVPPMPDPPPKRTIELTRPEDIPPEGP